MIIFWILAGGLVALALLFIVVPLVRTQQRASPVGQDALNLEVFRQRLSELDADLAGGFLDQDQYSAARRDLERDLLHDIDSQGEAHEHSGSMLGRWALAIVLATAVPLISVQLYLQLGNQSMIARLDPAASASASAASAEELPPMDELVARLETRLAQNPEDIEGWLMIGRTYFALEQPRKGQDALQRAYQLDPERLDAMLAYAESQLATGQLAADLSEQPPALIKRALEQDAANPNARWLGGLLAFRQGSFETAATTWQGIVDELDPASQEAAELREMVAEAQRQASAGASSASSEQAPAASTDAPESAPAPMQPDDGAAAGLDVEVQLDPDLAAQTRPDDTVFVFARAAAGPPMPLAAQRLQVSDLPTRIRLDDSLALNPGLRLSAFPEVVIIARVSKSGQTAAQPGDLEGQAGPLPSASEEPITLVIDHALP